MQDIYDAGVWSVVLVIIVARALIYLEMLKLERRFLNDWVEDAQRRVSGNEFQFGMKKKCRNKNKKRRHEICGRHDQRQLTTPLPSLSHHSLWDLHEIILSDIILPTCPADKWSGTPSSTEISPFITSKMARIGEHFETSCSPQSSLNSNLLPWGW